MTSTPEHVIADKLDPDNKPIPTPKITPEGISDIYQEGKEIHTGSVVGAGVGSTLGEYIPFIPKGTGAVVGGAVGGAVGYGVSRIKKSVASRVSDIFDEILINRVPRDYFDTAKTALTGGLDVGTARDVSGNIAKGAGDTPLSKRMGDASLKRKNWPEKSTPKPSSRNVWSRVNQGSINKLVRKYGGDNKLAKKIFKEQKTTFSDINRTVEHLNSEFTSLLKSGEFLGIGNLPAGGRDLSKKVIEFSKDHLKSIDYLRSKGLIGGNMTDNLEIIEHIQNLHKSNIHKLPDELADMLGMPKSLDEFVLKRMDPVFRSTSERIPHHFKQAFIIQTLDTFDNQLKHLPKGWKDTPTIRQGMLKDIVKKQAELYDVIAPKLKVIDDYLFGIGADETPKWIQNLELPPNMNDPFFKDMSPRVQQSYKKLVQEKNRLLEQMRRGTSIPPADSTWNFGQDN